MSGLFSTLGIAVSGLHAHQTAVNITANNIANVDTEGYSRQRVDLVSQDPVAVADGLIGRGVRVGSITRARNELLDVIYRHQSSALGGSLEEQRVMARVEDLLFEPSDVGLTSLLDDFFGAFRELAANPEEQPLRVTTVDSATRLADAIRSLESNLDQLRTDADRELRALTTDVNTLLEQVAELNQQIAHLEVDGGQQANELRDHRDLLLDQLSDLLKISTASAADGSVSVTAEGLQLVSSVMAYHIEDRVNPTLDPVRTDFVELAIVETGMVLTPSEGRIEGLLTARDTLVPELEAKLDGFTRSLVREVNLIHSQGRGLRLFETVAGTESVESGTEPLDLDDPATGLAFPPQDGAFDVNVVDSAGNLVTTTITVDLDGAGSDDSLLDIAGKLNAVGNLTASAVGGSLEINAAGGYTFGFSNDTSGLLTAIGINTLFTGSTAREIDVNSVVKGEPSYLAAALNPDPRYTGDNSNAVAMGNLELTPVDVVVGSTTTRVSLGDFLRTAVSDVGVSAQRLGREVESQQLFTRRLDTRRQEISGVNINEEVADLIRFQRGFDASARLISIIDEMLQTLISAI